MAKFTAGAAAWVIDKSNVTIRFIDWVKC